MTSTLRLMNYEMIKEDSYGGLDLVKEENKKIKVINSLARRNIQNFNWNSFPVVITEQEKSAFNHFDYVMSICKKPQTPSVIAQIPEEERTAMIAALDEIFEEQIKSYKRLLAEASDKDMQEIERNLQKRTNTQRLGFALGVIFAVGFFLASRGKAYPEGIYDWLVGIGSSTLGVGAGKEANAALTLRNSSFHRLRWLEDIDTLQVQFFQIVHGRIANRYHSLLSHLEAMNQRGYSDRNKEAERDQLKRIHDAYLPKEKYSL